MRKIFTYLVLSTFTLFMNQNAYAQDSTFDDLFTQTPKDNKRKSETPNAQPNAGTQNALPWANQQGGTGQQNSGQQARPQQGTSQQGTQQQGAQQQDTQQRGTGQNNTGTNTQWQTSSQPAQGNQQSAETVMASQSPDKILSYLLNLKMPKAEKEALTNAIEAFSKQNYEAGLSAQKTIKSKIAQKIAQWHYLRSEGVHASVDDIEAFRKQNPDWPDLAILRKRAELGLLKSPPSVDKVQNFFKEQPPISAAGKIVFGTTFFMQGKKGAAKRYFSLAWRNSVIDPDLEKIVLAHFNELISPEDHQNRINRILSLGDQGNLESATRLEKFITPDAAQIMRARAAVITKASDAEQLLNTLPEHAKKDFGVIFAKAQHYRISNKLDLAWKTVLEMPNNEVDKMGDPESWWQERERLGRLALKNKKYQIAYDLVNNHGLISGKSYEDAQFLAGWIALRYLSDTQKAKQHFLTLSTIAETPDAKARALYWLGRTAIANKDSQQARDYFRQAADYRMTYYGLIAETSLGGIGSQITVPKTADPTPNDVTTFFSREPVKAISVAHHAGLDDITKEFFLTLGDQLGSSGELVLLIRMARSFGYPAISVEIAEKAVKRGVPLQRFAYPSDLIRANLVPNDQMEQGALFALIREKSAFNQKASSPSGAVGMMQLLPAEAEKTAQKLKIPFNRERLTTDNAYNLQIGQAHFKALLDQYQNSLVLALAAYTEGTPRVEEWLAAYGDPRRNTDIIDWIENLPTPELRSSLQDMMVALQIYRSRLSDSPKPNQIMRDLTQVNLQQQPANNKPNANPRS